MRERASRAGRTFASASGGSASVLFAPLFMRLSFPGFAKIMRVAAVEVRGLRKSYDGVEAVRGIDFEIEAGEVFGVLGPNGAGKTSTVEILEGYRQRDAGEVSVLGFDPGRAERAFREQIGVVLQQSELWPVLTVR